MIAGLAYLPAEPRLNSMPRIHALSYLSHVSSLLVVTPYNSPLLLLFLYFDFD